MQVAAGPADVVEATNADVEAFTKSGTLEYDDTLGGFFSSVVGDTTNITDPQVVYDPYVNRFWASAIAFKDSTHESRLVLAMSTSSRASTNSSWMYFWTDATSVSGNTFYGCDRDSLGFDAQTIYFSCNMFSFPMSSGSFLNDKIRVMTTGQFISNSCCYWYDFLNQQDTGETFNSNSYTIQPARMHGAQVSNGEFLIDAHGEGGTAATLEVFQITNSQVCCVPGKQGAPTLSQAPVGVNIFVQAPSVPQPTGSANIDPGDTRLQFAIWQSGTLSTAHDVRCSGAAIACVEYIEVRVSSFPTLSLVNLWQTGFDFNRYYPAVDVRADGYKTMVYTRSYPDGSHPPSAAVLSIPPSSVCTQCSNSETITMTGAADYLNVANGVNRWGDYSGASADPDGQGIWVAGEYAANNGTNPTNVWGTKVTLTYEGQSSPTWVQESLGTAPPSARFGAGITYYPGFNSVILFGGAESAGGATYSGDTWSWYGTGWSHLSPTQSPPARYDSVMAYDAALGQIVLFGGGYNSHGNQALYGDTWTYNGTTWSQRTKLKPVPPARRAATMVYDSVRNVVVLFGGVGPTGDLADTWTFNGTAWSQQNLTPAPSARDTAMMAFDTVNRNTVLFGGRGSSGAYLADTWIWNGSTWSPQTPATSPAGREAAALANDDNLGPLVLFGGSAGANYFNDTWYWIGSNWLPATPSNAPSFRVEPAMAYDPATKTEMLFGGAYNGTPYNDTWTY